MALDSRLRVGIGHELAKAGSILFVVGVPGSLVGEANHMPGYPTTDRSDEDIVLRAAWSRSNRPLPRRLLRPLHSLEEEAASGVVLLATAAMGGTGGDLLHDLLPSHVNDAPVLTRVLENDPSVAHHKLQRRTVADVMMQEAMETRFVNADDNVLAVAWVMARPRVSLVGVVDKGDLVGGISTDQLVGHFLRSR